MKVSKVIIISFLVAVVGLSICYDYGRAGQADIFSAKIGVVSVRKIIQECKRVAKYKQESENEKILLSAELMKLDKEISDDTNSLKVLRPGTSDYMAQLKQVLEKEASLKAKQEFYDRQRTLNEQKMMGDLYEEISQIAGKAAEQKGLALVLRKDELLYSGGCTDITEEVKAQLDAREDAKQ